MQGTHPNSPVCSLAIVHKCISVSGSPASVTLCFYQADNLLFRMWAGGLRTDHGTEAGGPCVPAQTLAQLPVR